MKYKIGDRCKVIKNFLSPNNIGDIVTVIDTCRTTNPFYTIQFNDGLKGYASENCLELVSHET